MQIKNDIATEIKSWLSSCSTFALYHKCCEHYGWWVLSTGCDGRILLTTRDERQTDRHWLPVALRLMQKSSTERRLVFNNITAAFLWATILRVTTCLENLEMSKFDSCQGNVRDFSKNQGNVREKILSGKCCLKLFIVNSIPVFASIQVFSTSTGMIWITLKDDMQRFCGYLK